jgi:AraC family transcriptional regulator of adaptative response / DNA-3-methyladenine glycosylase II
MPLLAQLRQLFDLDAEPAAVDAHLSQDGLGSLVRQRPGLRIPGAINGFELALQSLLRGGARLNGQARRLMRRVTLALGEAFDTGMPGLDRLAPTASCVADAGASQLTALGVPHRTAETIAALAQLVAVGTLRMQRGSDVEATHRALTALGGIDDRLATTIVMRALGWPDAFPASDRALQRAAGVSSTRELLARAERWRPWRAYAALHLRLHTADQQQSCGWNRPHADHVQQGRETAAR